MATRRTLLSAAVLGLAPATVAAPQANPDAEVIRLCAEFDALERRHQATCGTAQTMEEEERAEPVLEAIREQQEPLLQRICSMSPTTTAGAASVAASLLLWDGQLSIEEDDPDADTGKRLLVALLRGLVGRA